MARGYIPVDRGQQFLIPPDMREWLPENHLVWFLLEVVDRLDTKVLHRRRRRGAQGRAGYDPDMLLALLIYAYCTKVRSSRQIERLCETDVAYRVICAGRIPDHTTIARFRQEHTAVAARLFADVLELCARAGLAQVGVVAVDGTKIAGNASRGANRSRERLEAEIAAMFDEAQGVDDDEDDRFGPRRGDELPDDLADPDRRRARLQDALDKLNEREAQRSRPRPAKRWRDRARRTAGELIEAQAAWEAAQAAKTARGERRGRPPAHPQGHRVALLQQRLAREQARAARQPTKGSVANVTDPDSALMPTANGWVQGYNAQAAVNAFGIVISAEVYDTPSDAALFKAMIEALGDQTPITGPVGVVLADAGYCSQANLTAPGPTRLIATTKAAKLNQLAANDHTTARSAAMRAMKRALTSPEGRRLYSQRSWTVEPAFGNIKTNLGFDRFSRRGIQAVTAEWQLITAAANLLKLHRWHPGAIRLA